MATDIDDSLPSYEYINDVSRDTTFSRIHSHPPATSFEELQLERAPSYTSIDPFPDFPSQTTRKRSKTRTILACSIYHFDHGVERRDFTVHDVFRGTMYYVRHWEAFNKPDVTIHHGIAHHGQRVAAAQLLKGEKDFLFTLSHDDDLQLDGSGWETVYCDSPALWQQLCYRFVVDCEGVGRRQAYLWKRTHERTLGASVLGRHDFKLVAEGSEEVVAVYVEHGKGSLEFREQLGLDGEMMAMVSLLAILERLRRGQRQINALAYHDSPGF